MSLVKAENTKKRDDRRGARSHNIIPALTPPFPRTQSSDPAPRARCCAGSVSRAVGRANYRPQRRRQARLRPPLTRTLLARVTPATRAGRLRCRRRCPRQEARDRVVACMHSFVFYPLLIDHPPIKRSHTRRAARFRTRIPSAHKTPHPLLHPHHSARDAKNLLVVRRFAILTGKHISFDLLLPSRHSGCSSPSFPRSTPFNAMRCDANAPPRHATRQSMTTLCRRFKNNRRSLSSISSPRCCWRRDASATGSPWF